MLVVSVYAAIGGLIVPWVLHGELEKRLTKATGYPSEIASVATDPFRWSTTLEGIRIGPPGDRAIFRLQRAHTDLGLISTLSGALTLEVVAFDRPQVQVTRDASGRVDAIELVERIVAYLGGLDAVVRFLKELPPVAIEDLAITSGTTSYRDETTDPVFQTAWAPVSVSVQKLSTRARGGGDLSFQALTETGESFEWIGKLSRRPLAMTGSVAVSGLQLGKYASVQLEVVPLETTGGRLDASAAYEVGFGEDGLYGALRQGKVDMTDLSLRIGRSDADFLRVGHLAIRQARASYPALEAFARSVEVEGGSLEASVNDEGRTSLDPLLELGMKTFTSTLPMGLTVERARVSDFSITARHIRTPEPDVTLALRLNDARASGFRLPATSTATFGLRLSSEVSSGGTASLTARVGGAFDRLMGSVEVRELDLTVLQPYVVSLADAQLRSGLASLRGDIEARLSPLTGRFTGAVELASLRVDDQPRRQGALSCAAIELGAVQAEWGPMAAQADGVESESVTRLPVRARAQALVLRKPSAEPGDFLFSPRLGDEAVRLAEMVERLSIRGRGRAYRSRALRYGPVELEAVLRLAGLRPPTVVSVDLRDVQLPPFSNIAQRYVGHVIDSGELDARLRYTKTGLRLRGRNLILLRDLNLGDKVDSPDAIKLPVKLGLALLKDKSGTIDFDVRVAGRLDDPNFKLGPVITDAALEMVGRAVASPFAAIGGLFAGKQEPDVVEFQAGTSTIGLDAHARLRALEKSLFERPELVLRIGGRWEPDSDRMALMARGTSPVQDWTPVLKMLADQRAKAVQDSIGQHGRIEQGRLLVDTSTTGDAPSVRLGLEAR